MLANQSDDEPPSSVTLPQGEALEMAVWLHQAGRLQEAESIYRAVLRIEPTQPDALHYLGVLHHQLGDTPAATELIRAALQNAPDNASAWTNLGNVLKAAGDREGALAAYGKAAELDPTSAAAYNNLGVLLKELDRLDDSETAYRQAIRIDPDHAAAYRNLGHVLKRLQRIPEALEAYAKALALRPEGASYRNLSYSLYMAGQRERAAEIAREWLSHEPKNPVAVHLLAALSGEGVPDRAADEFVREVFDGYADTFDDRLRHLQYRAPELVLEATTRAVGAPQGLLKILDAGCGTGLCGPLLRQHARVLEGVDLSPAMLARARARGVYDRLVERELSAHLRERPADYDLVVSADTLVYFGDLAPVASAAALALLPGGRFVFTVEDASKDPPASGFRLNPHGRYSHSETYVAEVLRAAGLELAEVASVVLRLEAGEPVAGLLVVARRPGVSGSHRA